jgi:hypothetical protein
MTSSVNRLIQTSLRPAASMLATDRVTAVLAGPVTMGV